jgi:5-methylcytosine-specific restriction endonuclease McrA
VTSRQPATPRKPAARLASATRQRGRYVPAAERREVFTRDGARCTFTDEQGQRCSETRYLELHHLTPFAHGGENVASNLTLRCSAHNALAAEEDFGRDVIEQKRGSTRHESLAAQSGLSCQRR